MNIKRPAQFEDQAVGEVPAKGALRPVQRSYSMTRGMKMITVLASIRVKTGRRSDFLEIFKANVPHVRKEKGCVEYFPTVDIDAGLPGQSFDQQVVTVVERWEDLEVLLAHTGAPHMLAYRKKVKDMVEGISVKVLQEA